jgi:predicted ATP-grasp superfamily ATP-dependent carboligase
MEKIKENAIVLGTPTTGLGIIRALARNSVPVIAIYYDNKDMGYESRYVKESIYAPHPEKCENQFIELLINCATRFEGSVLMPAIDTTLIAVSRHKSLLERYFIVACTDWEITRLFIEKQNTYALAEQVGVPAPKTIFPQSMDDVVSFSKTIHYPCLVKPYQGHLYFDIFRRKMVKVDDQDQLIIAYQQATNVGIEVMIQEYIPGDPLQGANYNSYSFNNEVLVEFTAQKIRNAPPETGSPCVLLSKHIPEVIEPGRKILKAMGFYGYACTEFKQDPRDGVYKLLEVNGRHNLSTLLAVRCGINFPQIHYDHLIRGELPSACNFQTNIYWIDIFRDFSYCPKYLLNKKHSILQFIKPYHHPHVDAIFDLNDLKPFRKRFTSLIKLVLQDAHLLKK